MCTTHECGGQPAFFFRNQIQRRVQGQDTYNVDESQRSNSCATPNPSKLAMYFALPCWWIFEKCVPHMSAADSQLFFFRNQSQRRVQGGDTYIVDGKMHSSFFATICLRITITKVEFFCSKAFPAGILSNSTKAVHCIFFCINHFIFFA